MSKIHEYIEAETARKAIFTEIRPLQQRLDEVNAKIRELNDGLDYYEKNFIKAKLWENIDPSIREKIEHKREEVDKMFSGDGSYLYALSYDDIFDPYYDDWYFTNFETKDDKVRFQVSCRRREGSINGLMTFLDCHWTSWIDIKDLDNL